MKKARETFMHILFLIRACTSILAVVLICVFLFSGGVPAMLEIGVFKFLFGTIWKPGNNLYGIFPMIIGSLYVTAGAILFGVPARTAGSRIYGPVLSENSVSYLKTCHRTDGRYPLRSFTVSLLWL